MEQPTIWKIRKVDNPKFPYRLTITKGKEVLLDLLTQDRWPGAKGNIFCLRAFKDSEDKTGETLEEVKVLSYKGYGKRLTVILDRPKQKRCSFLFLTKAYKNKEGEYEQIFWQTQQGLAQRQPKYKLAYNKKEKMTVFIDSGERYPWKMPATEVIRESLPLGDYAIKDKFGLLAVIERKTFNNFIGELSNLQKFHQHLSELENCRNAALVLEATYGDFLNQDKIRPYTGQFVAKALGEIQASHPDLPVIFAGGRKFAQIWAHQFFNQTTTRSQDRYSDIIKESTAKYGAKANAALNEDELRRTVFTQMPDSFSTRQLRDSAPKCKPAEVRRILEKLKNEGRLTSEKKGKDIIWKKEEE